MHVENAVDHAVCSQLFGQCDVAAHDFELFRVVTEIAATRADHHVESDRDCGPRHFNESCARRDSAFDQAAAELQARCPPALPCDCRGDGIYADLKENPRIVMEHVTSDNIQVSGGVAEPGEPTFGTQADRAQI